MPSIAIREIDASKYSDQTFISISYNGNTNDLPAIEVGGAGIKYGSIVYNNDNTITLIDSEGKTHTMVCNYGTDGKLVSVSYDGVSAKLSYSGDTITAIGNTTINLNSAPANN